MGCGLKIWNSEKNFEVLNDNEIKIKFKYSPALKGVELDEWPGRNIEILNNNFISKNQKTIRKNTDGSIEFGDIIVRTDTATAIRTDIRCVCSYKFGDTEYDGYDILTVMPDNFAPTKHEIIVNEDMSSEDFSKSASITAKFEETWDSIVEIALYDSNGKAISNPEWQMATSEGNNIFSKTFNVVAESTTTKELTVKAKDRCGNIGEGKVTIGKIDTKAPILVSPTNYNGTWTIGKEIKVEVTDEGAGEVEISLGDENDYQKATKQEDGKYTKTYHFTGELSDDIVRYVYVKDGVGNKTSYKLTIGKMDSTSPTVTNVSASGKTITVEANDMNTKLNKEGSGIKGYAVSKSKEVPSDNYFVKDKNLTVEESGTYYVWVKDNAGNLSEMKTVTIK